MKFSSRSVINIPQIETVNLEASGESNEEKVIEEEWRVEDDPNVSCLRNVKNLVHTDHWDSWKEAKVCGGEEVILGQTK